MAVILLLPVKAYNQNNRTIFYFDVFLCFCRMYRASFLMEKAYKHERKENHMKKFLTLLTILVLSLSMNACGADNSGDTNATTAETKPETTVQESSDNTQTSETAENQKSDYEPVTIIVDLERSGLGDKVEETFTAPPTGVVAKGDQMADYFFDLGLEDNMVGYTHGSCWSNISQFPARDVVPLIGDAQGKFTKEQLLEIGCDFLMGWDSTFSDKNFNREFCESNGIAMYTPYCAKDDATFEDIFKDYETLGKIFNVEDVATDRINAMKEKLAMVRETVGEEGYANPVGIFVYGSGSANVESPFTACKGMPGDMIKLAGGYSIFNDIDKGWASVSWEQVIERDPEVIMMLDYNGENPEKIAALYENEALKNIRAIKNKRIIEINGADIQGSAGSAGTVELIARGLYPDKFK